VNKPATASPLRAAIYARQSLDVQEGIDRQLERARALIAQRGWVETGIYSDNDTSASKVRGKGTEWARLLQSFAANAIDVVVAVDLDRLVRSTRDLITLIDAGAKVVTVDGEIDLSSADGEFRATMLAAIGRFEVRRKGERQRRANEHRAANGKRTSGRRAFGYEQDGVTFREVEADALRTGFHDFLAGATLGEIARRWNAAGLYSAQLGHADGPHPGVGAPWRASNLRKVFTNPRNAGLLRFRGEIVGKAEWEGVVDIDTFNAVGARLANPERFKGVAGQARYLLSGIVYCGVCGAPMHSGGRPHGNRAYRCSATQGHISRQALPIEAYVTEAVLELLKAPRPLSEQLDPSTDIAALQIKAGELRDRLEANATDYADGDISRPEYLAFSKRANANLAAIEAEIASAYQSAALDPILDAADIIAHWDTISDEEKRRVIAATAKVTILPVGAGVKNFRPESVLIERVA
jgi:site-specific DNA recombinase